jgi:DNA-binding response OmpR family regulator
MPAELFLVIDDEPQIRRVVRNALEGEAARVIEASSGREGIDRAAAERPDLIVLDLGLPDIGGVEVCRRVREFSDAHVLMLTAHDTELDKVVGFEAGADDYVTKPFSVAELVGRVKAVLRRTNSSARSQLATTADTILRSFGALTVDAPAREAKLDGVVLDLTRIEFDLLDTLTAEPRVAFSRAQLLERVWGENWFGDDHLVDVHISNLRRKLADDPRSPDFVATVRGVGYRMGAGR